MYLMDAILKFVFMTVTSGAERAGWAERGCRSSIEAAKKQKLFVRINNFHMRMKNKRGFRNKCSALSFSLFDFTNFVLNFSYFRLTFPTGKGNRQKFPDPFPAKRIHDDPFLVAVG